MRQSIFIPLLVFFLGICPLQATDRYQVFYLVVGSTHYLRPESKDAHGFVDAYGANRCARVVSSLLDRGGSVFGLVLTSSTESVVTTSDIGKAMEKIKARITETRPVHPLFVFYFMGHGLSEGIAWNHFCIPGNLVFNGNAADLPIEDLAAHALYSAALVEKIQQWKVPFIAILDTCSEGKENSFESSVLTQGATQSLDGVRKALRFMNEFHDTGPVLFASAPGTVIDSVQDPLDAKASTNVGPIARRMMLVLEAALKTNQSLSLKDFLQQLQETSLDALTSPAVTHSCLPSDAEDLFFVPSTATQTGKIVAGTGGEPDFIKAETASAGIAPDKAPLVGSLQLSGDAGEAISNGQKIAVSAPRYNLALDQDGGGSFTLTFDDGTTSWTTSFSTPNGNRFETKSYTEAGRWQMADEGHPGMEISGAGRGSNELHGSFTVRSAEYDTKGKLVRFEATFRQYSDDDKVPAIGHVEFETPRH